MKYQRLFWNLGFTHVLDLAEGTGGAFESKLEITIPNPNKPGMYSQVVNTETPYLKEVLANFDPQNYRIDLRRRRVVFRRKADALLFRLMWRPA